MAHPLDILTERGFVQDVTDTDGLRELLTAGRITFYYGADPSGSSLHIGNLIGLMAMAWLQRAGHRPIALVGGGTGRIGDPSGRDDERELLSDEQIAAHVERLRHQMTRVIEIDDPDRGLLIDNDDWLRGLRLVDFLRDVGKHFSVNQMIARESVRRRLEEREHGISFTEFSYQLLQAYDFAHLFSTHGCRLQIGGSDQWGNVTAGVDLTRRMHGEKVYGLVWPLVERSDGKKFSKSGGEAVWLASDETSPYAYYQWFLNVPDADVGRFLKLYTFLSMGEIAELEEATAADPAGRPAQRALAAEATRIMHGDDGLAEAQRASDALFGDEPFADLDERTLADAFVAAPSTEMPPERLTQGIGLLELMVAAGAAASNGEARRLVEQGGVRLNNNVADDPAHTVGRTDLIGDGTVVLRVGKKRYFLVRFR
ncbi:tyrosine--tRNA ligase [Nocardioides sp.]|jgi:tyrosyl-tRNA synthetase|uniref:tyrosine--tRNA ligase n=1 Tax=Nocardioides sp. TaxID=35761 RepID=UPI00273391F4|nr:tyrosine--tRNA ligase [Nocardioides sp.]MDP3892524.1 tyrosine--tRNA ligase [Nocardioides sp.]